MKRWKLVRNIAFAVLALYVVLIAAIGIGFMLNDAVYPDTHFGLMRWKSFGMTAGSILTVSAIPIALDIIMFAVSAIRLRKTENN